MQPNASLRGRGALVLGGGAGLLALLMWGLVLLVAGLAVAGMMAAG